MSKPDDGGPAFPHHAERYRYTVEEIDQMREYIRHIINWVNNGYCSGSEAASRKQQIEDRLRTYMLNGTSVAELEQSYLKEMGRWDEMQQSIQKDRETFIETMLEARKK